MDIIPNTPEGIDTTVTPPLITRAGIVHEDSVRKLLPDVLVAGCSGS